MGDLEKARERHAQPVEYEAGLNIRLIFPLWLLSPSLKKVSGLPILCNSPFYIYGKNVTIARILKPKMGFWLDIT